MILYISYDGLCEPLGQSQVYQYLIECANRHHHQFYLVTFEKREDLKNSSAVENLRASLRQQGIIWHPLLYHKKFSVLATGYDIMHGFWISAQAISKHKIKIVHARSYVSSVIALLLRTLFSVQFIFDMRGFWADEKVDVGAWKRNGVLYKVAKWFEKKFLLKSSRVISLTHAAVTEIESFSYVNKADAQKFIVIPTCVNLELFKIKTAQRATESLTVGYVGGARMWYDFDLAVRYFLSIKAEYPYAQLKIINKGEHDFILERLKHFAVPRGSYQLIGAAHSEVASQMATMDVAIFFIHKFYSKLASAPTKLGEFLACGVPCVTMGGVGDLQAIVEDNRVGVVLPDKTDAAIATSVQKLISLLREPELAARCRCAAESNFSLYKAVAQYDSIFRSLGEIPNEQQQYRESGD